MNDPWRVALSQLSIKSLRDLYSRDIIAPHIHSLIGEVLDQKTLKAATLTATALAVTVTNFAEAALHGSNSTTTPKTSDPIDLAGTVSWQSAFCALATIALNSCLQDSGNICEIEARLGILVKSSPVFCVVDALVVWAQIIYYFKGIHPREALLIVARSRQQHGADGKGSSRSVCIAIGRGLLLIFAILQVLKLYALRGIPWIQVFGTMYLFSYITNNLLDVLVKSQIADSSDQSDKWREDIQPSVRLNRYFAVIAACFQIAIWTHIVRIALPDQWFTAVEQSSYRWPVDAVTFFLSLPVWIVSFVGLAIFILGALAIDIATMLLPPILVLVASNALINASLPSLPDIIADILSCSTQTIGYIVTIFFISIGVLVQVCILQFPVINLVLTGHGTLLPLKPVGTLLSQWSTCTSYTLVLLALVITAILSYFLHRMLFMGIIARSVKSTSLGLSSNLAWACLSMFLANISLTLFYFSHIYSPEGTWKPSWTENLGWRIVW